MPSATVGSSHQAYLLRLQRDSAMATTSALQRRQRVATA
jgi:hypothetical protein